MMERDGLLVLFGHLMNVAAWLYFIAMFIIAGDGLRRMMQFFGE